MGYGLQEVSLAIQCSSSAGFPSPSMRPSLRFWYRVSFTVVDMSGRKCWRSLLKRPLTSSLSSLSPLGMAVLLRQRVRRLRHPALQRLHGFFTVFRLVGCFWCGVRAFLEFSKVVYKEFKGMLFLKFVHAPHGVGRGESRCRSARVVSRLCHRGFQVGSQGQQNKGTDPRTGGPCSVKRSGCDQGHRPEERPSPSSFRYPHRLVRFNRKVSYGVSESALRSVRLMFFVDFVNYDDDAPLVFSEVTLEALVSDQNANAWPKFSSHLAVSTVECCDFMSPSESSNSCLPSIKGFACGKWRCCTSGNAGT